MSSDVTVAQEPCGKELEPWLHLGVRHTQTRRCRAMESWGLRVKASCVQPPFPSTQLTQAPGRVTCSSPPSASLPCAQHHSHQTVSNKMLLQCMPITSSGLCPEKAQSILVLDHWEDLWVRFWGHILFALWADWELSHWIRWGSPMHVRPACPPSPPWPPTIILEIPGRYKEKGWQLSKWQVSTPNRQSCTLAERLGWEKPARDRAQRECGAVDRRTGGSWSGRLCEHRLVTCRGPVLINCPGESLGVLWSGLRCVRECL